MASKKKAFTAYCDWGDILDEMTNEQAGKFAKHLWDYVRDKNPETDDQLIKIAFSHVKATLKRDLKKWRQRANASRENGKLGGRPSKDVETQENLVGLKKPVIDKVIVKDIDIVKDIKEEREEVGKPTTPKDELMADRLNKFVREVMVYCRENNISQTDCKAFINYWGEPTRNNKKFRAETEKTFAIKNRFNTWLRRDQSNNNKPRQGATRSGIVT